MHLTPSTLDVIAQTGGHVLSSRDLEPSAEVPAVPSVKAIETAVRKRYVESVGFDAGRDGLVVHQVEHGDGSYKVRVRAARPLSEAQQRAPDGGHETVDNKGSNDE